MNKKTNSKVLAYLLAPFAFILAVLFFPVHILSRLIRASWEIAEEWVDRVV